MSSSVVTSATSSSSSASSPIQNSAPQLIFQPKSTKDRLGTIKASNYARYSSASSSTAASAVHFNAKTNAAATPAKEPAHQNNHQSEPHGFLHNITKLLPHHAVFQAKVQVHQLSSVPLVRGDFAVKWRFKNAYSGKAEKFFKRNTKDKGKGKEKDGDKDQDSNKQESEHDGNDTSDEEELLGHTSSQNSDNHSIPKHNNANGFTVPSLIVKPSSPPIYPSSRPRPPHLPIQSSYSSSSISNKPLHNPYAEYLASSPPSRHTTRPATPSRPNWGFADSMAESTANTYSSEPHTPAKGMTKYKPLVEHNVKFDETLSLPVSLRVARVRTSSATSSHETPQSSSATTTTTHSQTEKNGYFPGPDGPGGLLQPCLAIFTITQRVIPGDPFAPKNPVLGRVELDLSEYASSGKVTRKHLLRDSRTNATLQLTVEMEYLGGQRAFTCPPLPKAEILGGIAGLLENETYRNAPRTLALLSAPLTSPPEPLYPTFSSNHHRNGNGVAGLKSKRPTPTHSKTHSRNNSTTAGSGMKPAFSLADIPSSVGPLKTEALIEALFNPTLTASKRPSPFTLYDPPPPPQHTSASEASSVKGLDLNGFGVVPRSSNLRLGLNDLSPEMADEAFGRGMEEQGIGLKDLVPSLSRESSSYRSEDGSEYESASEGYDSDAEGDAEEVGTAAEAEQNPPSAAASTTESRASSKPPSTHGSTSTNGEGQKMSWWAKHVRNNPRVVKSRAERTPRHRSTV